MRLTPIFLASLSSARSALSHPSQTAQTPILQDASDHTITPDLFVELEELARIVDISYCVGFMGQGIQKPFKCASRCADFPSFELVEAWNTGPLLSDSCGYIAVSHPPAAKRIIVAFRGTYSIANTIADLSTVPQSYVPYPGGDGDETTADYIFHDDRAENGTPIPPSQPRKCDNCTVHMGFYRSWLNTRTEILPALTAAIAEHPDYTITLVGHSLGGAVAVLAALDLKARGFSPVTTTFGEPRIGNTEFMSYVDDTFNLSYGNEAFVHEHSTLRRVTHADDPIPLLPLEEWGYKMHAGEIYIAKPDLPPSNTDIRHCAGDDDHKCIAGIDDVATDPTDDAPSDREAEIAELYLKEMPESETKHQMKRGLWTIPIPTRYKLWQLFFAHRDYFWRLGLCVPGGDPKDWYRGKYPLAEGEGYSEEL